MENVKNNSLIIIDDFALSTRQLCKPLIFLPDVPPDDERNRHAQKRIQILNSTVVSRPYEHQKASLPFWSKNPEHQSRLFSRNRPRWGTRTGQIRANRSITKDLILTSLRELPEPDFEGNAKREDPTIEHGHQALWKGILQNRQVIDISPLVN